ncbi:FYVE zinc finger domain-containing protein CYBJADRAFT_167891 [Cyberlindnera jadinii NRRL Y-1542]|uniref:FYVE-type domain-containing protein n=1 Tax=Cyberlindnera jadinii (strain ATCC 18201 / CBS 1600 / BCRC 20928 / JCM 3617 / NBRC 0987 / NRRL Y-1542) TaxID=983966 RepID=A0A1E4S1C1_CYBJN|nr:hypothetical protein CYBJADRAFT_167891 [Cyberlindnera jadinii NRRL Y-1542]ODV73304.1 hypothetical protein CYBJADRAFT_167891 [Cyberlindnera jadinii NRRL Y-1542]
MDPERFSFSKKPISLSKRRSVISAIMPDSSGGSQNSKESARCDKTRTFSCSNGKEVLEEVGSDDPLLDYDEQIRAPKFLSKKSLDDIGTSIDLARGTDSTNSGPIVADGPLDEKVSSKMRSASSGEIKRVRSYQPAVVEIPSSDDLGFDEQPSTSCCMNYTLSQITASHLISNIQQVRDDDVSETGSPELCSKKNSEDSIVMMSRKAPHFNTAPLRPMSDPRTPNYVPCVLRPIVSTGEELLPKSSIFDSSMETHYGDLSRGHWKPNGFSNSCMDCHKQFSLMNRRHHCRKCGNLFCASCLLNKAKLNFQCQFDVNGILGKVCFQCGKQWSNYLCESFKMDVDVISDFKASHMEKKHSGNSVLSKELSKDEQVLGVEVNSNVPADWSWSSF